MYFYFYVYLIFLLKVDLNQIDTKEFDHLTREEYQITQLSLTEAPFSGKYNDFFERKQFVFGLV